MSAHTHLQAAIEYFTSLPLTAEKVYSMGEAEVARIKAEMVTLQKTQGHEMLSESQSPATMTFSEFLEALKNDPKYAPKDGPEIVDDYRSILKRSNDICRDSSKKLFGRLPVADYEIKEVEAYRNKHAPPAFYYPPAADGSRGGIFYANTYLPETRGKYVMESIALHEAIPGHHFQIALAQELENLPFLRKQANDFTTAYIGMCVYARLRASACASACACVCTRARGCVYVCG